MGQAYNSLVKIRLPVLVFQVEVYLAFGVDAKPVRETFTTYGLSRCLFQCGYFSNVKGWQWNGSHLEKSRSYGSAL